MASVAGAAASGDQLQALTALRDVLAESIDAAEPQYRAALARQLTDVLDKLAGMKVPEVSARDEIAAKRARRKAQVAERSGDAVQRRAGSGRAGGKRGSGAGPVAGGSA